jgi:PAS domain S-box-containing protein
MKNRNKKQKNKVDEERQTEEHARFLPIAIQQCSEGVAMADLDGNLKYLNDAFARMHGYSPSELLGKNLSIFHTPEQLPLVEEANRQIRETGKFRGEIWHTRRDGSVFPGIMHNSLVRDEEGNPVYMLGMLRNITQRKQLEEAMKKSEKRYRLLADNITDVILVIDVDVDQFVISYVSPSVESVFGYTPSAESVLGYTQEELRNLNAFDFLTPHSADRMKAVFKQEVEKDKFGKAEPQRLELEVLHKDGLTTWIEASARFLRDNKKKVKSILCVIRDISKRKKSENALRKSEEQYRLLAENVTDVIAVIDLDQLVFDYISPSAESVFGYTKEEFANMHASDILTPHSADYIMAVVNREVEKDKFGKAEPQRLELEVLHKNGLSAWMEVSARFLRDNKKQVKSILCVIRDISKRREAEEALKKSRKMLHLAKNKLEEKVRQRTSELEERNIALKVLLDQRDQDKKKLEETIISNIRTLIEPNLTQLKNSRINRKQKAAIKVLESNLNEITSPFLNRLSSTYLKLTLTEIQVANFLKHGATTKEIAESLNLSQRTIDTHRFNIRKKIGIKGKSINLKTYLSSC